MVEPLVTYEVSSSDRAQLLASALVGVSTMFTVEPMPDDVWHIIVRSEPTPMKLCKQAGGVRLKDSLMQQAAETGKAMG